MVAEGFHALRDTESIFGGDAGYEEAIECARERGVKIPML
jgi:hypothetical protein